MVTVIKPSSRPPQPLWVLGVRVDPVTQAQAVARIDEWLQERTPMRQVVTVNTEFVMEARRNTAFRLCLNEAALNVPDSVGMLFAARLQGRRLTERVGGVELTDALARHAAHHGYRLFLLGAAEGVASQAARALQRRYPGLQIAGTYAGSPHAGDRDAILTRLRQAAPDILFVAYGAPEQELWISQQLALLPPGVAVGVGGTFDYLAGLRPRAPRWMQRMWLEWLFRLITQPWRWRRMGALPHFAVAVLAEALRQRRARA